MKVFALFLLAFAVYPDGTAAQTPKESFPMQASGTFDVKVVPQTPDNAPAQSSGVARLSLDKQFHGDLEATSQGEMLASGDGTQSGAYVAIEKVNGSLHGQGGSFVLVHRALMVQGTPQEWTVAVVPDSGTGALRGISGSMRIEITEGKHFYRFDYALPQAENADKP
ncbi:MULTISPECIES: DUF3224 domain-containing protein [unclassified Pseudoxanthomonas]|uniref:DUF3224 domain-containing protein n=1 Tax=unclassified Pseudoxanthomonas TaxID=2645906 RepID=UPI0030785AE6